MAAGDIAYAVSHTYDNKTERQRGKDVAAAVFSVAANEHCGSAAQNYKNHCADKFGNVLFYRTHFVPPFKL
jgi:hypothetical protein